MKVRVCNAGERGNGEGLKGGRDCAESRKEMMQEAPYGHRPCGRMSGIREGSEEGRTSYIWQGTGAAILN